MAGRRDERETEFDRYRRILQGVTEFAAVTASRDGKITQWNEGAERLFGWSGEEAVGQDVARVLVLADGSEDGWQRRKDGSGFRASCEILPLRGEADAPAGSVIVLRDLRESESRSRGRERDDEREQLAAIFSQAPSFMALLRGPDHRFERVNPSYTTIVGGRDVVGRTVAEALPEAASQGFVDLLDSVYRSGEAFHASSAPFIVQAAPEEEGVLRYLDFVYQPIRDADRRVVGIFVEGVDVTDRIVGSRRLRQTEDRYRLFVENVDVGICIIEMKFDEGGQAIDYRIVDGNGAYERYTGLYGSVGKWVSEAAPGLERHWFDLYGKVASTGEPVRFEQGAEILGGRWYEVQAFRVGEPEERQVAILFTDVTDRRQAETQRETLNAELAHRLKNNLALVQSIATQTLRTAPDLTAARKTLMERIGALSKAHDILMTGRRDAAPITEVVRSATALHDDSGRVRPVGPEVSLGSKAALTLSLILHELSTNAGKYGALSVPGGQVVVAWSTEPEPETRLLNLVLEWREIGGPRVEVPTKKSFGTRLIEMGLSGSPSGTAELVYAPDGLVCRLVAPLSEMQADGDEGRR